MRAGPRDRHTHGESLGTRHAQQVTNFGCSGAVDARFGGPHTALGQRALGQAGRNRRRSRSAQNRVLPRANAIKGQRSRDVGGWPLRSYSEVAPKDMGGRSLMVLAL